MNRYDFQHCLDRCENTVWKGKLILDRLLRKKNAVTLAKNSVYKDKHKGQTCFILGNGPSLKLEERLGELKEHCVFSVNQLYRSPIFQEVAPQYHVMMDPLFFDLDPEDEAEADTLRRMQVVAEDAGIQMILPVDAYEFVEKNLGNACKHSYIKGRYRFFTGYRRGFDMAGYLPSSRNVVQTAIYCAIYMGFERIVLLGCDMTGLLDNYVKRSPEGNCEKFTHVYEYNEAEKQRMRRVHDEHDNESMLEGFYTMFKDFRVLTDQCEALGVELLNASKTTAIDNVPFADLNDILDEMRK